MPLYSDEAIVLRTHKLAEADRIITLLTREHGVVRAVAKGVRRTSSRFGSRLEPFTHVDLQLAVGRNLDTITQAETRAPYGATISADYDRYTAGERDARDRRTPGLRGAAALRAAVPPARGRPARDDGGGAPLRRRARLVPAEVPVGGRLRPVVRCLCQLRPRRSAPGVQPGRGRDAVPDVPGARARRAPPRRPCCCWVPCWPATGRSSTRRSSATVVRRAVSCRRSSPGTSSGACGPCPMSARREWRVVRASGQVRRPEPHPSGATPPAIPADLVPAARRDHHGRQRAMGTGARPAPHRRSRAG